MITIGRDLLRTVLRPYVAMGVVALLTIAVFHVEQPLAQDVFNPPVLSGLPISSAYAPRIHNGVWQFHRGVDFPAPKGYPITAIEGGEVETISIDGLNDWYIAIRGTGPTFERYAYIHIFDNDPIFPKTLPRFSTLPDGTLVTLETLENLAPLQSCLAIVFWISRDFLGGGTASRVLTPPACAGQQMFGVTSTSHVAAGHIIAPTGDSGSAKNQPHVHLTANHGNDNPLYYVRHPITQLGLVFDIPQGPPSTVAEIGVLVDSTGGKDLNAVQLFANQIWPNTGARESLVLFRYNGRPDEPQAGADVIIGNSSYQLTNSDGSTTGVIPESDSLHRFVFQLSLGLQPGLYLISADLKNIRGQVTNSYETDECQRLAAANPPTNAYSDQPCALVYVPGAALGSVKPVFAWTSLLLVAGLMAEQSIGRLQSLRRRRRPGNRPRRPVSRPFIA